MTNRNRLLPFGRGLPRAADCCLCVAVLLVLGVRPALAQLPKMQLDSIFPAGAKAGSEVEVKVDAADLDAVDRLAFSHAGITAEPKLEVPHAFTDKKRPVRGVFRVKIAANVPPGGYEVRTVGRFGASIPRTFTVGTREEVIEERQPGGDKNFSPQKALAIQLNTTISARATADRMDYYRFDAKKGQRILVDCAGERIDSKIDATLAILDATGRLLLGARDTVGRDPILVFDPPADGAYVLAVYDFLYRGGNAYHYRLSLDGRPRVDAIFPPAGLPGSTAKYTLYGRNLPGSAPVKNPRSDEPLEQLTVDITLPGDEASRQRLPIHGFVPPHVATMDGHLFRWNSSAGPANPVLIGFAAAALVTEVEPNDDPPKAQKVSVPCEVAGQFQARGDRDWFAFDAKQGEVIWIDVFSHRMGRDTDPYLVVQKVTKSADGKETVKELKAVDEVNPPKNNKVSVFSLSTKDPSYRLVADADATYRVMVRDLYYSSRGDPRMTYRLLLSRGQPDFRLVVYDKSYRKDANKMRQSPLALRRGGTATLAIHLERREGFDGEVRVAAQGLPPGVTCAEAILQGPQSKAALVFSAEDTTAAWTGAIRVVGRSKIGDREVVREARGGMLVWKVDNAQQERPIARIAKNLWLSVTDKENAPAHAQLGDGKVVETSVGGKVELPLAVVRQEKFKSELKFKASGLSSLFKPNTPSVKGADGKFQLSLSNTQIKPGTYTFHLWGTGKLKYARNPDAVKAAKEDVSQIEQVRKEMETKAKAAAAAKVASVKMAQEMTTRVTQARQKMANTQREADAAAAALKQATEKLEAAREALKKEPEKKELADGVTAAEQAATAADGKNKETAGRLATVKAEIGAAEEQQKTAEAAKATAEKMATETEARKKQATDVKTRMDAHLKKVIEANKEKDVEFAVASTLVRLRVVATPIVLKLSPLAKPLMQGEKIELPVTLERKYGFDAPVTLQIQLPGGTSGIGVKPINIEKGKTEGRLEISANKQAKPGDHRCTLRATLKFNNVTITSTESFVLKVAAPPPMPKPEPKPDEKPPPKAKAPQEETK